MPTEKYEAVTVVDTPCTCYTGGWFGTVPPPRCFKHQPLDNTACGGNWLNGTTATVGTFTFSPFNKLSDEDVERVAKRVAELLREPAKL